MGIAKNGQEWIRIMIGDDYGIVLELVELVTVFSSSGGCCFYSSELRRYSKRFLGEDCWE